MNEHLGESVFDWNIELYDDGVLNHRGWNDDLTQQQQKK